MGYEGVYISRHISLMALTDSLLHQLKKVQVGNNQEKAQSEKKPHPTPKKPRREKLTYNKVLIPLRSKRVNRQKACKLQNQNTAHFKIEKRLCIICILVADRFAHN